MNKVFDRITAIIILVFITLIPILTIIRTKGDISYQENRKLSELPEFSFSALLDGSYTKALGVCFSDYFAGRSYWISANGVIEANVGEGIVNDVYINEDMLLKLPDTSEKTYTDSAEAINRYSANYNGTVYLAAIPTSSGVYSEKLPVYLSDNSEKKDIDLFYKAIDDSVRKIDAYNILKMLNENYIYYRNDTRWTSYGAYCVYRTVIQKLGFHPSVYDKFTIEHVTADFRGNLYNKSQYTKVKADMLDIYNYSDGAEIVDCIGYRSDGSSYNKRFYDKSYIDTNDMHKLYLGEDEPFIRIKTTVNNKRKILIINDNYGDCFIPFLLQHYSEIAIVSPYCLENGMSEFVNTDDYEQTLILYGIENLDGIKELDNINR